ncbi:MAG: anhydro-N-acetylmuramic acid kinase [Firmicutes bacterium]|nr:anhydro-N-acetylmuramic acid kinase [Bacillota bacterium]
MTALILGMMVGTSCDGVSAALVETDGKGLQRRIRYVAGLQVPFPDTLRQAIFALYPPHTFSSQDLLATHLEVAETLAAAAKQLLTQAGVEPRRVRVIGMQGPIILHSPPGPDSPRGGQLELGDAAVVAERTGIRTLNQLRAADAAAGGQGAPLSPYVDYLLFHDTQVGRAVQNLGGIANVTPVLPDLTPDRLISFDTGPANMVIDGLMEHYTRGAAHYDRDGRWAAQGKVHSGLLAELLSDPYFRQRPPKTTGREKFGLPYAQRLAARAAELGLSPRDAVATATALTAASIAQAYRDFLFPLGPLQQVILGGGGTRNPTLVAMLRDHLAAVAVEAGRPSITVLRHEDFGIPSEMREAITWAILADETLEGIPANLPSVTGARHPALLGNLAWPPPDE